MRDTDDEQQDASERLIVQQTTISSGYARPYEGDGKLLTMSVACTACTM
jgi:hypothetical protein